MTGPFVSIGWPHSSRTGREWTLNCLTFMQWEPPFIGLHLTILLVGNQLVVRKVLGSVSLGTGEVALRLSPSAAMSTAATPVLVHIVQRFFQLHGSSIRGRMEKSVLRPLQLWVPPEASSSCFLPPTLPPLWMLFLVSICTFFHWVSQCDSAWWVPLARLSWLPSRLACNPLLFYQAPSPHPSIVDGFK